MAQNVSGPSISPQERSSSSVDSEEKFSRWLGFSFIFHLALIGGFFIVPFLPTRKAPTYPVYTVDLVGGERIGRSNLGTEPASARKAQETAKQEVSPPVQEKKPEIKKEKADKIKVSEKVEKSKPIEKPTVVEDKIAKKQSMKTQIAETKTESKTEAALENVRERLIQSAIERVKSRTESGEKTSKGEEISSGAGEGRGAAALGPGGTGGGVAKGIDFIRYQNQMLSTIKNNWVWVGQKGNLRVTVHFNIKDNGEIVGLKLVQPSGNASYDDSVLRAVRKSSPLPPPSESVRKDFSEVELTFKPEDLGA